VDPAGCPGCEGFRETVHVRSAVSLLHDAASELAEGTAAVGKAVSGRLADRFARRPLIAAS
jgi:hypothetical protein